MENEAKEHSITKSVILHFLPGILTGLVYYILAPVVLVHGYPTVMALSLAGIIALVPFELGYLLIQRRKTGQRLFHGVIRYLRPVPAKKFFIWVPVIIILSGLLFTAFGFTSDFLKPLFKWIPERFLLNMGMSDRFSIHKLIITYTVFFLTVVLILPVTEELYFRGYLLPRMPGRLKKWTPLLHGALFSLYHTWTPWMFLVRAIGVLPLIIVVRREKNIYIGIIAHCLLNSIDFIQGVIYIGGRL